MGEAPLEHSGSDSVSGEGGDLLREALDTVAVVMRGQGGRNAMARLSAARAVLGEDLLKHLPDEALLAEVLRRKGKRT